MKKTIFTLVALAIAAMAFAEYNASKHEKFVESQTNLMFSFQDNRESCARLVTQWFTESISGDVDFVDHPSGVTTAEMTAAITYCQAFEAFNENSAVATSDRQQILVPFVGTRVLIP